MFSNRPNVDAVDDEENDKDEDENYETDLERTFSNLFLQTEETNKIEEFSEIKKVEHLYVHSKSGYQVGTYLKIYMKLKTRFAHKLKNDQSFRQNIWDRLNIKDTRVKKTYFIALD